MEVDEAVLGALAEARALGFLGPGPLEPHLTSAAAFAEALGDLHGLALDLGSGGGVPGLLLAATFSEVRWTLLDRHRRRTSFLSRVVASLGWVGRVQVVRVAAEEAAHGTEHRGQYRAVVARSFGPPPLTAEIAAGFLVPRGLLLVAEPPEASEDRWPTAGLASLGLERRPSPSTAIAVFSQAQPTSSDIPRAWRTMERRPRW